MPGSVKIWMYHRVLPPQTTAFGHPGCYHLRGTAITPEMWADDLKRLQPIVSLAAVINAFESGQPAPGGNVLTFDDGYAEWSELVAPSLCASGATATFFITTGMHREAGQAHAIDAYYWLLDHAAVPAWTVTLPGGEVVRGDLGTRRGKSWLVVDSPIKVAVRDGDAGVQAAVLAAVQEAVGVELPEGLARRLYLDERQWRGLAERNLVGAHGVTHRPLTGLDDGELETELVEGRRVLQAVTGKSIEMLSYPDGAHDARVMAAARRLGYRAAVLAEDASSSDVLRIPRLFRRAARE